MEREAKEERSIVGLVNGSVGGLKVPLRAFCWKARGGGGTPRLAVCQW